MKSKPKISKKKTVVSSSSVKKTEYDHKKIEGKWQKKWEKTGIYKTSESKKKPKCYVLDMFPYPSGEGLHVGHPKGYIATDIYSRFKRMSGFNVLHPMGWDAFGLPAENYAIKSKVNPSVSTAKNVKRYKEQLSIIGLDYDWSREINTTDPKYYKWTQWTFLKMLEHGLAYQSFEPINWCPSCKTGLANEDLEDGRCERCGSLVEKKPMRQWVLKITDYAERLLCDLDAVDDSTIPHIIDKKNPPQKGKKYVERKTIQALVRDPKTGKFLGLKWKKHPWTTFIVGGVDCDESVIDAARREVAEETGYKNLKFVKLLGGPIKAEYFAAHKNENRIAYTTGVLFELESEERTDLSKDEEAKHEPVWLDRKEITEENMTCAELPYWLERLDKETEDTSKLLLNWPQSIKESQRNWIGRSEGAMIKFKVNDEMEIEVFTTRPDTLFGVTYVVLAPESELIHKLESQIKNLPEVKKYITSVKNRTEIERTAEGKEKTGVPLEGIIAINPATKEEVPVWIADYVLADYGTGAVMAVPAHDERDWAFAKKYNLPIKEVISPESDASKVGVFTESGKIINSGNFDGMDSEKAKKAITEFAGGRMTVTYKIKDWVFSRQRYWGEPIPVIHCEKCGIVPVPEKDLPVVLPKVKYYEPTGTGESPLAAISKWVNVKCPKCKSSAKRETNTMPQWAGSSWYYLRYIDPKNSKVLVDKKKEKYWSPVDMYVGGAEHATRHLIYARFWHKFLYDIGAIGYKEPFLRLKNQGLIMGADGRKMSKRFGNVINPDDVVKTYGADTLRVYESFMGPFENAINWSTDSMVGSRRFLEKVWRLALKVSTKKNLKIEYKNRSLDSLIHKMIKKVGEDVISFAMNTAVSSMMILVNEMDKEEVIAKDDYEKFLKILAPFAPHVTEELWLKFGHKKSIHIENWPKFDASKVVVGNNVIVIQINGKVRASIAGDGSDEEDVKAKALSMPEVKKWIDNKEIKKIIFVKNKLINIVV